MPGTLLIADLNRANDDELAEHLNGLFGPPQAPGGGYDPSNIIPRQITVEAPAPPEPPAELAEHVQALFSTPSQQRSTPLPPVAPPPVQSPLPSGDVVQQLADQVGQATGLTWIGEGLTNLRQGAEQAGRSVASGLTSLAQPPPPAQAPSPQQPGPLAADPNAPRGPFVDYARQAAARAGIDADVFVRQIQQESGFNPSARSPAGATGIAQFMPGTARGMGIDPTDPYASLDAGARLMRTNLDRYGGDYAKALAAYNAGPGNVDKYGGVPPFEETQRYIRTILGGSEPRTAPTPAEGLTRAGAALGGANRDISQFGDAQLTNAQAYAACGPAAAVRFAQRFGRNPTLSEAVNLARTVGWTEEQGMAGLGSEKALMDKMGVPTKMVSGAQWDVFAREAQTGNPVTISTRGHYFTADGYDPGTGRFHVGRSGLDLKGGSEWMTPEQMTQLMGAVQGGLLADNPQAPTSTVATASQEAPQKAPGRARTLQVLEDEGQTAAGFTAPGGPDRGFLDQAAGAVGEGFSRLGEAAQGGLTILDNAINASAPNPTPASVPGGGYDPSALGRQQTPPPEGVPLRQDVRDLNLPPQPTLLEPGGPVGEALGAVGELPGLSEADRAARRQALEQSPVGQIYGSDVRKELLPNITEPNHPFNVMAELQDKYADPADPLGLSIGERMTPEDRQRWNDAKMAVAGMAAPSGVIRGRAARAIDYEALAKMRDDAARAAAAQAVPPTRDPSLADRIISFTVNNVLSNPASLLANAAGGVMETVKRPTVTAATAGVEALTGNLPGARTQLGAAGADVRAMGLAVGDVLGNATTAFTTGRRVSQAADQPEAFEGAAGMIATPFLRGMGATDEAVNTMNSAGAQAAKLVELMRANPKLSQADVMQQFQDEILAAGRAGGAEAIFQTGGTGIGESIARARRQLTAPDATVGERIKGAAANVVVPFSSVPDVLLTRGAKRIPGVNELVTAPIEIALAMRRGDPTAAKRAGASAALATAVNTAIWTQVQEGNITGNGPSDESRRRALMQARDEHGNPLWRPNSIKVGDQWIPYSSLGAVAVQIGAIANAVEQYEETGKQVNPDYAKAWGKALGETIMDAWYLQTVSGVFSAIQNGTLPEWMGTQALSTAGRVIPEAALWNQFRGVTDPIQREPKPKLDNPDTWLDYYANRLPLASETVQPKIDPATGQPMQEPRNIGSLALRATAPGEPNPVNEELARHNLGVSEAPKTVTLPAVGKLPSISIGITDDEQRRYQELTGQYIAEDIRATIADPGYQRMSGEDKRKLLQDIIGDARRAASKEIANSIPDAEFDRRIAEAERAEREQAQPSVRLPAGP